MATILIIDDSPAEVFKLTEILTKHNYQVASYGSAEEGLAAIRRDNPDVVLMDVVMPGMNGFQATRQLSRDEQTRNIPVVIISMKDQETDRIWGERQGAKAYLTKPVSEKQLLNTITQVARH